VDNFVKNSVIKSCRAARALRFDTKIIKKAVKNLMKSRACNAKWGFGEGVCGYAVGGCDIGFLNKFICEFHV
jgi:hypothetical protein